MDNPTAIHTGIELTRAVGFETVPPFQKVSPYTLLHFVVEQGLDRQSAEVVFRLVEFEHMIGLIYMLHGMYQVENHAYRTKCRELEEARVRTGR